MSQVMFEQFKIGEVEIKNRLVASAMFEYAADNGRITNRIVNRYRQLAEGGFGLIITGMQAVNPAGAFAPIMVNVDYDAYIEDLSKIVEVVHQNGTKIFVQLNHCGKNDLNVDELKKIAVDFGKAALKCKSAGVDGVQVHAGHGFLVNSLLSPSTNHRTDEYGGSIENRARLLFEIYDSIRNFVGNNFTVGVKFPFSDLIEQSITPEESLKICRELEEKGLNFIEITSGMVMDGSKASFTPRIGKAEAPFLESAKIVADELSIPVVSVCGYRTPNFINDVLSTTKIAAVSFGRPTVRETDFPNRWLTDSSKLKCVSCNKCCDSFNDGIITCQIEKKPKNA